MEISKICEFYRDKNILITGATGFVGKLLVEKLLRVCKPKALYLMIRSKKSVDPHARLSKLFDSPIFEKLKENVPNFMDKLVLVPGDMLESNLGLADADRKVLLDTIQVVFHCAATVKFDEALSIASKINIIGTKSILDLCREMKKLESVVYVSTAYSHCPKEKIEEDFYDAPISATNLMKLTECLNEQQLQKIEPFVLNQWPNTYAFTKAVAEDAVNTFGKGLPIAVFRPAIMVSTREDPVPGWIDNLYGPTGLMVGYAAGIIRVMRFNPKAKADIVPADMTVNCLIAIGYKTSLCSPRLDIPIYNFTTHKDNILTWNEFLGRLVERGHEIPSSRTVWYYTTIVVMSSYLYWFLSLLLHLIPAFFVDCALVALNKKPQALKIYKKIHKFLNVISYFSLRSWNFSYDNVNSLWKTLDKGDKELFDFDMASLDWKDFLRNSADGLRMYMFQEKPDTLEYARKRFLVLWFIHRTVQAVFFGCLFWSLWSLGKMIIRV